MCVFVLRVLASEDALCRLYAGKLSKFRIILMLLQAKLFYSVAFIIYAEKYKAQPTVR